MRTEAAEVADAARRRELARGGLGLLNAALGALSVAHTPAAARQEAVAHVKAASNWRKVSHAALATLDPWAAVLGGVEAERADEYLFNARSGQWRRRSVLVRVDLSAPFGQGRMRRCFRLKKSVLPAAAAGLFAEAEEAGACEAGSLGAGSGAGSLRSEPASRSARGSGLGAGQTLSELLEQRVQRVLETSRWAAVGGMPSSAEMGEWAALRRRSVLELLPHVGRSSLVRVRPALGLAPVGFRHRTVLTLGETLDAARRLGEEACAAAFERECHGMREGDMAALERLFARGRDDDAAWAHASLNQVAKQYINPEHDIARVYRHDVAMQEVCKLLCERFNRHEPGPPKKVDMLHVGLLRLVERPGQPWLGYESYVEGDYIKYNTNGGWVESQVVKHTPQAFSFATWRLTMGELMVVDVQGVSEIYTDPQVHSRTQKGYGEGDLGSRGHALFLRTFRHELNPVVQRMGLQRFAMLDGEVGPALEAEVQAFRQGRQYLDGEAWARREALAAAAVTRRSSLGSGSVGSFSSAAEDSDEPRTASPESRGDAHPDAGCGTVHDVVGEEDFGDALAEDVNDVLPDISALPRSAPPRSQINAVPDLLLECAAALTPGRCPSPPVRQRVPARETAEAAAHAALADLYDLQDERVCGDLAAPRPAGAAPAPSPQECSRFHRWMAALAGSPAAMMAMASAAPGAPWPCGDADRVGWAHMASLRGSRAGGILAFQLADPQDRLLRIAHLQRAVDAEDGKSERERKDDLETCQHELLALLAAEFEALGESGRASECLTRAAERALEAGDFKMSAKYQERAEAADSS